MINFVIKILVCFLFFSCVDSDIGDVKLSYIDKDENKNLIYDKYEKWLNSQKMEPRLKKAYLQYGKFTFKLLINPDDEVLRRKAFITYACINFLDEWKEVPGFSNVNRIRESEKILYDNAIKKKINKYVDSKMNGLVFVMLKDENEYCTLVNL